MRYISLFSGIEAASVAWGELGWEPVAFSEIEPFPCDLLRQRYPEVPNLGDITKIDWSEIGPVDLIVGGSPCQSFSVAGKREGLKGESGLMFEYIRAVRELRPAWFVWENVPGALTSEHGAAFGQLLTEMDDLGYGLAWRVLDAQFFGVAQRRRRVFLIGCLGNPECAGKVLFEPDGMCWDFTSSREKRKELAASTGSSASESSECLTPWDCQSKRVFSPDTTSPSLQAGSGGGTQNPTVCYAIQGDIARGAHMGQNGKGWSDDGTSYTQNTIDQHAVAYTQYGEDIAGTLTRRYNSSPCSDRGQNIICMTSTNSHGEIDDDICGTLTRRSYKDAPVVAPNEYVVRRLMPIECERLQGFPDGWTDIVFKGKQASDAARYKALGNSMAVPVMRWIGERIREAI